MLHHIWYRIFINKSYRCWEYFFKYFQDILVLKNWILSDFKYMQKLLTFSTGIGINYFILSILKYLQR